MEERNRSATWQLRAQVTASEQASQLDALATLSTNLKATQRSLYRAEVLATDASRAGRVAAEQRDVALARLADAPALGDNSLAQLQASNDALIARTDQLDQQATRAQQRTAALKAINQALNAEIVCINTAVHKERDHFLKQLAKRTKNFKALEHELTDARQTYIDAADRYDTKTRYLGYRLRTAESARVAASHALATAERFCNQKDETIAKLQALTTVDCSPGSPISTTASSQLQFQSENALDVASLSTSLKKVSSERDRLLVRVENLEEEATDSQTENKASMAALKSISVERDEFRERVRELEKSCLNDLSTDASEPAKLLLLEESMGSHRPNDVRSRWNIDTGFDDSLCSIDMVPSIPEHRASQGSNHFSEKRVAHHLTENLETATKMAKEQERETTELRNDMRAIHSHMRIIARGSLPKGVRQVLEARDLEMEPLPELPPPRVDQ